MALNSYRNEQYAYNKDLDEIDGIEYPPSGEDLRDSSIQKEKQSQQLQSPPEVSSINRDKGNTKGAQSSGKKLHNEVNQSVYSADKSNPNKLLFNKSNSDRADLNAFSNLQDQSYRHPPSSSKYTNLENYTTGITQNAALSQQYQSLIAANEGLKNQIALLEVSLHNETLTSEEQRAYIEVLKKALETKINEAGLMEFITSLKNNTKINEIDLFIELNNIKTQLDHHQKDQRQIEERTKSLTNTIENLSDQKNQLENHIKEIDDLNTKLNEDNKKLIDNIISLQEDNNKLGQEKDTLLDYIEESRAKQDNMENELKSLTIEKDKLKEERLKLQDKIYELTNKNNEIEKLNKNLNKENEELKNNKIILQKQLNELESNYKKLNSDHTFLKSKYDTLNANNTKLEKSHNDLKSEYEELNKKFVKLNDELEDKTKKLKDTTETNNALNMELLNLKKINDKIDKNLNNLQIENEEYLQKFEELLPKLEELELNKKILTDREIQISDLKSESSNFKELYEDIKMRYEKDRHYKNEEIKHLNDEIFNLRNEIRICKEDIDRLNENINKMTDENKNYKDQLDKKQKQLVANSKEILDMKKLLDDIKEDNNTKKDQIEKFEKEINELNLLIEDFDNKLKYASEAKEKLMNELQNVTNDNRNIKDINTRLIKKCDELQKYENELLHDNKKFANIIENCNESLKNILKKIDEDVYKNNDKYELKTIEENIYDLIQKVNYLLTDHQKILTKKIQLQDDNHDLFNTLDRLKNDNDMLYKTSKSLEQENKQIKKELEQSQVQVNALMKDIALLRDDYEKLKTNSDIKISEGEKTSKEKIKQADEKYSKLLIEKNNIEYAYNKYREITLNQEVNNLIQEAKQIHYQIASSEREKLDIKVKIDVFDANAGVYTKNKGYSSASKNDVSSPQNFNETLSRRKLEEYKDKLKDLESHLEIYHSKKYAIESELNRVLSKERQKYINSQENEKQNHQLKTELEILKKDYNVIEQTKQTLEESYNELNRELKKLQKERIIDEKINASFNTYREGYGVNNKFTGAVDRDKIISLQGTNQLSNNYSFKSDQLYDAIGRFDNNKNETKKYDIGKYDNIKPNTKKYDSFELSEKYITGSLRNLSTGISKFKSEDDNKKLTKVSGMNPENLEAGNDINIHKKYNFTRY